MHRLVLLNEVSLPKWVTQFEEEFEAEMTDRDVQVKAQQAIQNAYSLLRSIADLDFSVKASGKLVDKLEAAKEQLAELCMWMEDIDDSFPAYCEREYGPLVALTELVELVAEYDVEEGSMHIDLSDRVYKIIYLAAIGSGNKAIPDSAVPGVRGEGAFHYYLNEWADFNQFYPENEKLHKTFIVPLLTQLIAGLKSSN